MGKGQLFDTPIAFKKAITLHSMINNFQLKCKRSERDYYDYRCRVENCAWKITAATIAGSDIVRVVTFKDQHQHNAQDDCVRRPKVSSNFLSEMVVKRVTETPSYTPKEIRNDFRNTYNMDLSYMQSWRTKEKAIEIIEGKPCEGYAMVPLYFKAMMEAMPGSYLVLEREGQKFKRLFVAYECSINGFQYCRPFVSIDGTFLSGNYRGTLLSATGYDADDGLYPLAYAIVSSENDDDWRWFLEKLKVIIRDRVVTIMSDRHQGIINGVRDVFGEACHSWCLRHLMENYLKHINTKKEIVVRRDNKEALKKLLNDIAYARTAAKFDGAVERMGKVSADLVKWVFDNGPEHWANALFPLPRWDKLYSNQAESFNAWIKKERSMSVNRLVLTHYERVTEFFLRRKTECDNWSTHVGPRTESEIKDKIKVGESFGVALSSPFQCTIYDDFNRKYVVDARDMSCSCLEWSVRGVPCVHACRAVGPLSVNIYAMVQPFLLVDNQRAIFSHLMAPIATHDLPLPSDLFMPSKESANDPYSSEGPLLPPNMKRQAGRPKKNRIESQTQDKLLSRCSKCRQPGHNRRNCKNPIVDDTPIVYEA